MAQVTDMILDAGEKLKALADATGKSFDHTAKNELCTRIALRASGFSDEALPEAMELLHETYGLIGGMETC